MPRSCHGCTEQYVIGLGTRTHVIGHGREIKGLVAMIWVLWLFGINFPGTNLRRSQYQYECVLSHISHVWLFVTLWTVVHRLLCPWDSPVKNTGVGCHFLLQGIILTQGSNPGLKFPALAGVFFITSATWEALIMHSWAPNYAGPGLGWEEWVNKAPWAHKELHVQGHGGMREVLLTFCTLGPHFPDPSSDHQSPQNWVVVAHEPVDQ